MPLGKVAPVGEISEVRPAHLSQSTRLSEHGAKFPRAQIQPLPIRFYP